MDFYSTSGVILLGRAEDKPSKNGHHDVQTMQHAGEQVGGNVRAYNDGGRSDAQGEEEGESDMWGL